MSAVPRILLVAALVALTVVLGACGDRGHRDLDTRGTPAGADARWVVTAATQSGRPHPLAPGTQVTIALAGERITIRAGCNTMSGRFELEGTRLTVTDLASTEMGCARPLADQDAWLAGLFAHPVTYAVGKDASITAGDVVLALAPPAAEPDRPLPSTHWVLDTVTTGDVAGSVPGSHTPTLRLDGQHLQAYDGCNSLGATAVVRDSTLVVSRVVTTTMACLGSREVQDAFARVLGEGTSTWSVGGDRLTLTRGAVSLTFHAVLATR